MSALSIELPDKLADTSQVVAQRLGLTQSELIRRALVKELEKIQGSWELDAIVASFEAMKRDPAYLAEVEEWDTGLETPLPEEADEWWKN
jgi:predicted transcriptional regulator